MRALVGVMLVGWSCCHSLAAESGSKWWPFGRSKNEQAVAPSTTAPQEETVRRADTDPTSSFEQHLTTPESTVETEQRWMFNSPMAKVSWPRFHMPELPKPSLPPSPFASRMEADPNRNSWVDKPAEQPIESPMQAMKNGARRVGQSSRSAWNKTVDALTPGDQSQASGPSSRVARRERPSMLRRMFGADDATKKEGSQTMTEFMAQDRL
jgi:hypothetical protein